MPEVNFTASEMFANAARFTEAYYVALAPLCEETNLPPMEADILMFLANNPGHETAKEICRFRGLKPGIVSFHVERLAQEGYLERRSVPGDRRKTALICTAKAAPLIQRSFAMRLTEGLSTEDLEHFRRCIAAFERNIDRIRRSGKAPDGRRKQKGMGEEP